MKNKTYLIESFIQQKKEEEAQKAVLEKPSKLPQRPSSVRKVPDLRWNINFSKNIPKTVAASAEPTSKMEHELSRLTALNSQLVQILEKNSIEVPNDILSCEKQRVTFAVQEDAHNSKLHTRTQSRPESTTTLPYVIPDISRASSSYKRISRPESGLSATIVGTPSIAGSHSRPCTARQISRPGTSSVKRAISARLRNISGFD